MKIAYLSASPIPSRFANSIQVMKMCGAFVELGHEVVLVARLGDEKVDDDFKFYGVSRSFAVRKVSTSPGGLVGRLASSIRAASIVHSEMQPAIVYARHLPSLVIAVGSGTPFVLEAHVEPSPLQRLAMQWLFRRKSFLRLVVISQALADRFAQMFPGLPSERIVVAHDAADTPVRNRKADLLLDGPVGVLRVGFVSQLHPGKGMEMIARLAQLVPDLHFHVVGGTAGQLASWKRRTESMPNITLHGFATPAQAAEYQRAMDILIAPFGRKVSHAGGKGDISRWMSPLKIFEYMAARKAIVASDLPVLREVLTNGEDALLVEPDDVEAWVHALKRLRDPELRERLAKNAYTRFEAAHTWRRRAETVLTGLSL